MAWDEAFSVVNAAPTTLATLLLNNVLECPHILCNDQGSNLHSAV